MNRIVPVLNKGESLLNRTAGHPGVSLIRQYICFTPLNVLNYEITTANFNADPYCFLNDPWL